jgi:hypothetical protein
MRGISLNSTFKPSEVHSLNCVTSPSWQLVRISSFDTLSPSSLAAELVVEAEVMVMAALVVLILVSPALCIMFCFQFLRRKCMMCANIWKLDKVRTKEGIALMMW